MDELIKNSKNALGEAAGVAVGVEAADTPQYLEFAKSCVVAVSQPASQRHSQGGTGAPCPEQSGGPKGHVSAGAGVGLWRGEKEKRGRERESEKREQKKEATEKEVEGRGEEKKKHESKKESESHRRGHDCGRGHRRDREGPVGRDEPGVLR